MSQRYFFALPDDVLAVFNALEIKVHVASTRTGMFDAHKVQSIKLIKLIERLSDLPGHACCR